MGIARTGKDGKLGKLTREHLSQVANHSRKFKAGLTSQEAVSRELT
jgi:hypothetical protein